MASTLLKKFTDMFLRQPVPEDIEKDEVKMLCFFRKEMISRIQQGKNCRDLITSIIHVTNSSFIQKYALLNVSNLLMMNNQGLEKLKKIVHGLSMIVKYTVCLMDPKECRKHEWDIFPFYNQLVQTKITPLAGYDTILNQLGYVEHCEQGLRFVPNTEPDKEIVTNLIADMMLFKAEIKEYLRGTHPQAKELETFIPYDAVVEVNAFRVSLSQQNMTGGNEDADDLSSSDENPFEVKKACFPLLQENSTANCLNTSLPEALCDTVVNSDFLTQENDPNANKVPQRSICPLPEVTMSSPVTNHPTSNASGDQSSGSSPHACDVCGFEAQVFCRQCFQKPLCNSCNESFHMHPSRRGHTVEAISNLASTSLESQPPVQIEGAYGIMAQNETRERRQRFNKSQETEVVKSPSKEKKSHPNLPALVLLGFNSVGEDIPEQIHDSKLHDAHKRTHDSLQIPTLPSHLPSTFDSLHQSHPLTPMHGNNTPTPIEQMPGFKNYNRPPQALPYTLLNQSLSHQGGLSPYEGQNHTYRVPFSSAQIIYNAGKIRMGHSQSIPQQGLPVGQEMFYLSPQQKQWQTVPLTPVPPSYTYDPNYQLPGKPGGELTPVPHKAGITMGSRGLDNRLSASHPYFTTAGYSMANSPNVSAHNVYPGVHPYNTASQNAMMSLAGNTQCAPFPTGGITDLTASLPAGQFPNSSMNMNQPINNASMHASSIVLSPKLQEIMSLPNVQYQLKGCENAIEDLNVDIQNIQERIDQILLVEEDHTNNSNFSWLSREKSRCLKEKGSIIQYLKSLKENITMPPTVQGNPQSRMIFFPPRISTITFPQTFNSQGQNENTALPNSELKDAPMKKHSEKKRFLNEGLSEQQSTTPPDKSEHFLTSSPAPIQNQKDSNVSVERRKQAREPVESSSAETLIRPPVPPRHEKKPQDLGNVLEKILSPPRPSQLKTESKKSLKWHCEHCTFLNEGTSRICNVCNKTSDNPVMEVTPDNCDGASKAEIRDHLPDASAGGDNAINDAVLEGWTENQSCSSSSVAGKHQEIIDFQEQVMNEKKKAQREYASTREKEQQKTVVVNSAAMPIPETPTKQNLTNLPQSGAASGIDVSENEETQVVSMKSWGNAQKALARRMQMEVNEMLKKEGKEVLDLVKAADIKGYKVEAVEIAQIHCKSLNMTPLQWLDENWTKYLEKIRLQVKNVGTSEEHNCVGELSLKEAEISFISCHGNINEAVLLAVENRKELFDYLNSMGNFAREEILQVMHIQEGNTSKAQKELMLLKIYPFLNRVWDQREPDRNENYGLHMYAQPECFNSFSTSIISHDDFQRTIKCKEIDKERRIRMILVEGKLKSWGRAELVIKLLDEYFSDGNISLEDVVDAVRNCCDRESALVYLQQECLICYSTFPMNKIRSLNFCQCKMCEECLTTNFEIVIREKHIRYWSCPICSQPDLMDLEKASDYISFLSLLLQPLIDEELRSLFETKVRDLHLQKDPHFRWCAHCAVGFLAEDPNQLRMTCFNCRKQTCFKCKKQWEEQHENLTCEQFAEWKIQNDPTNQAVGLAKHLEENGIDCPNCKMRFALAKGGCMHFHCPECGHEFCSGCNETYYNAGFCQKYKSCKGMGLHCHHPRDCFSYLRDRSVAELQSLLKHHQVRFNVEAPQDQEDVTRCPVMEQKESGNAKKDEKCGKESVQGQAGLCESHYKEYLTGMINGNGLDPLLIMSVRDVIVLLGRHELEIPSKDNKETDFEYKAKLNKMVEANLPLKRR